MLKSPFKGCSIKCVYVCICLFTYASTGLYISKLSVTCQLEHSYLPFDNLQPDGPSQAMMISDNASPINPQWPNLRNYLVHWQGSTCEARCWLEIYSTDSPMVRRIWERLIGLTKTVLKKVLRRALVNLMTLQTIMVEVEAVLNDWPLKHLSFDLTNHSCYLNFLTVNEVPAFLTQR